MSDFEDQKPIVMAMDPKSIEVIEQVTAQLQALVDRAQEIKDALERFIKLKEVTSSE